MKVFFVALSFIGLCAFQTQDLPALNSHIIRFVDEHMGKKVGRGECWDLAAEALDSGGANWDGLYQFGKAIQPNKELVLPGDIIQFERVMVERTEGNSTLKENYAHHTAIVYQVLGEGNYILAHQNTGYTGKKVGTSPLNLKNITKGKYSIFRPVKE